MMHNPRIASAVKACMAIAVALIMLPAAGNATQNPAPQPVSQTAGGLSSSQIAGKDIPCQCRFGGQKFELGQQVCIRGKMAECTMSLNNTSWKFLKTPCPIASYAPEYTVK